MFMKHYAPTDVNQALKLLCKWGSDRGEGSWLVARLMVGSGVGKGKKNGVRLGRVRVSEPRIELIVAMHKTRGPMVL